MSAINKLSLFVSATLLVSLALAPDANAAPRRGGGGLGGDMALGIGISTVSASQDDLNSAIDAAVISGANIKNLGSAWEFYANWAYRFTGTIYSIVFRPSYFMQSTTGSGAAGSYKYDLSGFTVFPIFRLHALENDFIKFFMQTGLGYGSMTGAISAGASNLDFRGGAFGAMGGIGVDFCFTGTHCLTIEGNIRYMPIERNLTTGGNCTAGSIPGISQCGDGQEVERANNDLKTTFSGVQGLIGYTMNF